MLKIAMIPVMARMVARLDLKPTIQTLKNLDIFDKKQKKMSEEQVGIIAFEIAADILPQLDKLGAEIPEFISLYKGISIAEANELDALAVFAEIKNDKGVIDFFKSALRRLVEQKQ